MSDGRNGAGTVQDDFEVPMRSPAPHSRTLRLITLLSATLALGLPACSSDEAPTAPAAGASLEPAAEKTYTAVDLGTLGGTFSFAFAINPAGQIAGGSATADGTSHAFLWSDGITPDLGTLGGSESTARDINASGQIVGQSQTAGNEASHAFLWENGVMTDLGTFDGGQTFALGINPRGQVAGFSTSPAGGPLLWQKGAATALGTLGGPGGAAEDVNPAGQVAGYSGTAAGEVHAMLWTRK